MLNLVYFLFWGTQHLEIMFLKKLFYHEFILNFGCKGIDFLLVYFSSLYNEKNQFFRFMCNATCVLPTSYNI